jgi:hypothetical protein
MKKCNEMVANETYLLYFLTIISRRNDSDLSNMARNYEMSGKMGYVRVLISL